MKRITSSSQVPAWESCAKIEPAFRAFAFGFKKAAAVSWRRLKKADRSLARTNNVPMNQIQRRMVNAGCVSA